VLDALADRGAGASADGNADQNDDPRAQVPGR
jgi:hypothetical protein